MLRWSFEPFSLGRPLYGLLSSHSLLSLAFEIVTSTALVVVAGVLSAFGLVKLDISEAVSSSGAIISVFVITISILAVIAATFVAEGFLSLRASNLAGIVLCIVKAS